MRNQLASVEPAQRAQEAATDSDRLVFWISPRSAWTHRADGTVYRTNKPSNTAFRTFGNIQPYDFREEAIEHAAHQLGRRVLPEEIRRKNLYRTGSPGDFDLTHPGATSPRAARPSRSISGSGSIWSTRRATPWRRGRRCTPSSRRRAPASRA